MVVAVVAEARHLLVAAMAAGAVGAVPAAMAQAIAVAKVAT